MKIEDEVRYLGTKFPRSGDQRRPTRAPSKLLYVAELPPLYKNHLIISSINIAKPCELPIMFYQGDLQSGIALAVREAKSVVCFVRGMSVCSCRLFPAL